MADQAEGPTPGPGPPPPPPLQQQEGAGDGPRTLWVGDLAYWMDEAYLQAAFSGAGADVSKTKVMRNKQTGQSEGYGFVEFTAHDAAERAIATLNGTPMPSSQQSFRINWASFGIGARRPEGRAETTNEYSIFVGDLAPEVNDLSLFETFKAQYPSARAAKVVTDLGTGRSKGFGFVRFSSESERDRALSEMSGAYCGSRPMRISLATPKKPGGHNSAGPSGSFPSPQSSPQGASSSGASGEGAANTTIFVGGLDSSVTEDELRRQFAFFGDLVYVKVPPGKGCGFVQFVQRAQAENALARMNGHVIGRQPVRLSWGRSGRGAASGGAPAQAPPHGHQQGGGFPQGFPGFAGYPPGYPPMYPFPPATFGFVDPYGMAGSMGPFHGGFPGGMPDAYAQGIAHMAAHPAAAAAAGMAPGVVHMGRGADGSPMGGGGGGPKPDARMLNMMSRDAGAPMMLGANMLLRPPPPFPRGGRRGGGT